MVTEETFQELRGWLKSEAPENMPYMLVAAETSQEEMSWSKTGASPNI